MYTKMGKKAEKIEMRKKCPFAENLPSYRVFTL